MLRTLHHLSHIFSIFQIIHFLKCIIRIIPWDDISKIYVLQRYVVEYILSKHHIATCRIFLHTLYHSFKSMNCIYHIFALLLMLAFSLLRCIESLIYVYSNVQRQSPWAVYFDTNSPWSNDAVSDDVLHYRKRYLTFDKQFKRVNATGPIFSHSYKYVVFNYILPVRTNAYLWNAIWKAWTDSNALTSNERNVRCMVF